MKRIMTTILVALFAILIYGSTAGSILASQWSFSTPAQEPVPIDAYVVVTGNIISLRNGPSDQHTILGVVRQGEKLVVQEQKYDCSWLKVVTSQDIVGWITVDSNLIALSFPCGSIKATTISSVRSEEPISDIVVNPENTANGWAVIQAPILMLRNGPHNEERAIEILRRNDATEITGRTDDCTWLFVTTSNQINGWVLNDGSLIALDTPCSTEAANTEEKLTAEVKACVFATELIERTLPKRGRGELLIQNDSGGDILVRLKEMDGTSVVIIYITADDEYRILSIPENVFQLDYAMGARTCDGKFRGQLFEPDDTFNFAPPVIWTVSLSAQIALTAGSTESSSTVEFDLE